MKPEHFSTTPWKKSYDSVAPEPRNFPTLVEKVKTLGGGVVGDISGLPRARLAVLPGTTHVSIIERTDWLASMTTDFLDAPLAAPKAR
jgi:hypothetical protein